MNEDLLSILICPETKEPLVFTDQARIERLNLDIAAGKIQNRAGNTVEKTVDQGLVSKTNPLYLYPVRDGIPSLLVEESIAIR